MSFLLLGTWVRLSGLRRGVVGERLSGYAAYPRDVASSVVAALVADHRQRRPQILGLLHEPSLSRAPAKQGDIGRLSGVLVAETVPEIRPGLLAARADALVLRPIG